MRRVLLAAALAAAAAACKTRGLPEADASAVKTDETRATIKAMCRDHYADGDLSERVTALCAGLERDRATAALAPLVERYCDGAAARHFDRIVAVGKDEGHLTLLNDARDPPSASERECLENLAAMHAEGLAEMVAWAALGSGGRDPASDDELRSLLTLPEPAPRGQCWRLVRMDAEGCAVASPCVGGGPATIDALPLDRASLGAWRGPREIAEGREIRLCNETISRMHRLKDPNEHNVKYNYPFANLLTHNRSHRHVTYGAANCHGTAQALAGGVLESLPVPRLGFHSDTVRETCGKDAEAAYAAAKARAAEAGLAAPTGAMLPVERGGYVVNMVHDRSCDPNQCGEAELHTFSCEGSLESHVFFKDMCIHCWDRLLEGAGRKRLAASADWKALIPGCVLTATDHSVTVVWENDGFCYFYESLSPYAPPQLNVAECPSLYRRFPGRWCPERPAITFALRAS